MLRDMDKSFVVSGVGHTVVILWVLFGDVLFRPPPPAEPEAMSVSTISSADFDAMMEAAGGSAAPPETETPEEVAPTQSLRPPTRPTPPVEERPAEPVAEPPPPAEADPEPVVDPLPEADVAQPEPVPEPIAPPSEQEQPVAVITSSPRPRPRPSNRVAPVPQDAPPEDVAEADEVQQAVAEEATPETPPAEEQQEAAAPPEAATEVVTEATETEQQATLAPTSSKRPQSRPRRPDPTPEPPRTAASSSNVDAQATDDAVAEALAAEAAEAAAAEAAAAAANQNSAPGRGIAANGPPMSSGEKDALRVAVERCWNVGSLSTEAQRAVISIYVTIGPDKKPVATSIELASNSASDAAGRQAFEAARRAILRCGANGFPLPDEKYESWRELELIFDKGRVGL
ncbi:cell envelope biogenesis protein TolA [Gemmobacter denitrificans]|uniref:Cell envelope biogenesis protein TolA n=1 Tax=Gemmobacter denitrificans TaxID=3123040 RepID=A0ABU8BUF4_9RHOB